MLIGKRMLVIVLLLSGMVACSKQNTPAAKENVEQALNRMEWLTLTSTRIATRV
jgi:hypothetical protein